MAGSKPWWEKYKVDVPEGKLNGWAVEKFEITKAGADLYNLQSMFSWNGGGGRRVYPGHYTRLVHHKSVVMSDTPAEIGDHHEFIMKAVGHVLITGLGLGVVVNACLNKPHVESVTVIEINHNVIDLVAPHYEAKFGARFVVWEGDALKMKIVKGTRWDCAWYDIWPTISDENIPDMCRLHRRFGRRVDYQRSWCRKACERLRRQQITYIR